MLVFTFSIFTSKIIKRNISSLTEIKSMDSDCEMLSITRENIVDFSS